MIFQMDSQIKVMIKKTEEPLFVNLQCTRMCISHKQYDIKHLKYCTSEKLTQHT